MEYKVAPSYKNATIVKVDPETHKAIIHETCNRCGGSGEFYIWGTCFKCGGAGKIQKVVKAYTPEEYEKYLASQSRAKERKANAEAARKQALIDNSEANKRSFLIKMGYDPENPFVYIVFGENTFSIKDTLKEMGAHFTRETNWYFTHTVDLPDSYSLVAIPFDEIFEWIPLTEKAVMREDAATAIFNHTPHSNSEYIGEIKERIRDLEVTLKNIYVTQGYYGTTYIYTFKNGENILVWMTTADKDIKEGETLILTGTVKSHDLYKGEKQTKVTRCIIKRAS